MSRPSEVLLVRDRGDRLVVLRGKAHRGMVVVELLVAAVILALVLAALSFYFVFHLGTMDAGRAQLKLQRVGSLVMEEMARAIRSGKSTDLAQEAVPYSEIMITYPDGTTQCFRFTPNDISVGPDYGSLTPLDALDDSQTVGSVVRNHRIFCDNLQFVRNGKTIRIRFTLRHDLDNTDAGDDLAIGFGSTVKLRG